MSEKWTPGPWFEAYNHWGRSNVYVLDETSDSFINDVAVRYLARELKPEDACLIAAAPELARELERLVRLLQPLEQDGSLHVPGLATLNGARAALAKARGE